MPKLSSKFAGSAYAFACALILAALFAVTARADEAAAPVSVMTKPRPDYDAQGIPLGGDWLLFPSLLATANYDNNVFRVQNRTASDWYFETTPAVRLQRKFDSGAIALFGNTDTFNYVRFGELNLTDWSLGADGTITVGKELSAAIAGYYGEFHEDFSSADVIGQQLTMTRYFRGHLDSAMHYITGDWQFSAGLLLDRLSWRPTTLTDGTRIDNTDRNETVYLPSVSLAYRIAPGYQLFVRTLYDARNFDRAVDRFGFDRSSAGYRVDGGMSLSIGQSLTGQFFAGWLVQDFAQHALKPLPDVSEFDFGADLEWYARPDLTVHFTASRSLADIILPGVSVSDDRSVRLGADWEIRDDVILQGFSAYTDSRLIGIARTDRYPSGGLTLRYLINRYASAELAWLHTGRNSSLRGVDFADDIVTAGLVLHI